MPYIEKIEMKGFKSYGNRKVVVPLAKGFTAIVGANGSGKSNIGDAVLFVLGGLSAKAMRATRISDLIFAGSKAEPPAKYAEVSMYFNNEDRGFPLDEDEIVIKRRVYPDGRSGYWLNGKRATRSEILDILSAAMISPEGYNLVLQGDITKFIKMSPVERRLIIDDISGIAEYDAKKEKALSELKEAEENLARVDLLISEVKKQMDKLEKERNDALRYLDLKSRVEKTRVQLVLAEINELERNLKVAGSKRDELESEEKKLEERLKEIALEIVSRERELTSIQAKIEQMSDDGILELTRKMDEVKAKMEMARRNIENAERDIKESNERLEKAKKELERLEKELTKGKASLDKWRKRREKIKAEIKEKETVKNELVIKLGEIDRNFAEAKEKFDEVNENLEEAKRELYTKEAEISRFKEEIERQKSSIVKAEARRKSISSSISSLKGELEKKRGELSDIDDRMRSLEVRLKKASDELERKSSELERVREELSKKKEELIKAEASGGGTNRVVEALKAQKMEGIRGTLGELITVKDERFSTAVEVALGSRYDNVVVDDDKVAERAIEFLKRNKLGRLTFLPLSHIKPRSLKGRFSDGIPAMDVVSYDPAFRNAVAYALGDTLIVNDMNEARRVGIGKVRMVTIDGELLERSGAITGGHYRPKGRLGASHEVESIKKSISKLESLRNTLESEVSRLKLEVKGIENELFNLRIRRSEVAKDIELLRKDLERLLNEDKTLAEEIKDAKAAIEKLNLAINDHSAEMAKLKGRIERLERKREKLRKALENPETREINAKLREVEAEIGRLKEELSRVESKIEDLDSRINEELLPRKADTEEEIEGLINRIKALRSNVDENRQNLKAFEEELKSLEEKEREVRSELVNLRKRRDEIQEEIAKLRNEKDEVTDKLQKVRLESNTIRIRIAQLERELEAKREELASFDRDLVRSIKEVQLDVTALKSEIESMESEMKRLEPVNMKAIEDFAVVERRYMELKSRKEQVVAEKESIEEFIREIEGQKKAVFMETLNAIASNFSELFSKLSPGGTAKLILENPDDPFSGGLEIEAKPAGKDVKRIEAMSGGEKALTALAFVFAIQRYKPAPFYLFDEIDAHLDDANVKRVADLIKEAAKESQFIVMTLRDVMMANADRIIGVFMRNGVSRVVSLSLEKARKIIEEARKRSEAEHEEMFGHIRG